MTRDLESEDLLIERARTGDKGAFERLVAPHEPSLRSLAVRMVMQPDDAKDLVQDSLLKAYQGLGGFRSDATFRTWLFSIVTRRCIDHLRARKRWPVLAQTMASKEHGASPELMDDLGRAASAPDFEYDFREHIAYCFSCIGRTLDPEDAAAVLLRDVFELSNDEAAQALGVTASVLRHRLGEARRHMIETYDGLCTLVSKRGACWQCSQLRDAMPEGRRGLPVAPICAPDANAEERLAARLAVVRSAKLGTGSEKPKALYDYILEYMTRAFD